MFGNCGLLPLSPYLLCSAADYVLLVTAGHGRHGGCLCGPDLRCEVCTSNLTRGLNTSRHTTPSLTGVRLHYASLCTQFVYIYVGVTAPWKVDLQDVLNNFTFSFNLTLTLSCVFSIFYVLHIWICLLNAAKCLPIFQATANSYILKSRSGGSTLCCSATAGTELGNEECDGDQTSSLRGYKFWRRFNYQLLARLHSSYRRPVTRSHLSAASCDIVSRGCHAVSRN